MDDKVLLELASKWERDGAPGGKVNDAEEEEVIRALQQGRRECKCECADTLRALVKLLGD